MIIHELGHGIAAINEGLEIHSFGVFFALIFPGAYMSIDESIAYFPPISQLRVYSAGIWANLLMTLLCNTLLLTTPLFLSIFQVRLFSYSFIDSFNVSFFISIT
jgi:S2P endopeptidase